MRPAKASSLSPDSVRGEGIFFARDAQVPKRSTLNAINVRRNEFVRSPRFIGRKRNSRAVGNFSRQVGDFSRRVRCVEPRVGSFYEPVLVAKRSVDSFPRSVSPAKPSGNTLHGPE